MSGFQSQIPSIDIPSIFMAAQQIRNARLQEEKMRSEMNAQRDREVLLASLPDAYAKALGGDFKQLIRIDPGLATQVRGQLADEQQRNAAAADAQAKREAEQAAQEKTRIANVRRLAAGRLRQGPQYLPDAIQMIQGQNAAEGIQAPQLSAMMQPTPEMQRRLLDELEASATGTLGQEKDGLLSPEEEAQQMRLRKAGATSISNTVDTSGLQKSVQGNLEEKIADDQITLGAIEDIKSLGDPSRFLGLKNKLKVSTLGALASVDDSLLDKDSLALVQDARDFGEGVDQLYFSARKVVTGTGAGERELREIRKGMLNTDLSSPEFKRSLERLERTTRRNIGIRQSLLRSGVRDPKKLQEAMGVEIEKQIERESARKKQSALPADKAQAFEDYIRNNPGATDEDALRIIGVE